MAALLTGVLLLTASFLAQLVIWRVALPSKHTPALLAIFTVVPALVATAALSAGYHIPFSGAELVRIGLFYVSFSLVYISCYSAIETESATLAIVVYVANTGACGCDDDELRARFGGGSTIEGRLEQIERSGWVLRSEDALTLTQQGRFWAKIFDLGGRVFGLTQGG